MGNEKKKTTTEGKKTALDVVIDKLIQSLEKEEVTDEKKIEELKEIFKKKSRLKKVGDTKIYYYTCCGKLYTYVGGIYYEQSLLFWQNPYMQKSYNYFSEKAYTGINVLLLGGGEYVTIKGLQDYNTKKGTTFKVDKKTKAKNVVYASEYATKAKDEDVQVLKSDTDIWASLQKGETVYSDRRAFAYQEGVIFEIKSVVKYTNVFSIGSVHDDNGKTLPAKKKMTKPTSEEEKQSYALAYKIIQGYLQTEKIELKHDSSKAYYAAYSDSIHLPLKEHFKERKNLSGENIYIRALMHEIVHSTGNLCRLARNKEQGYNYSYKEKYSFEELVAEIGSLFLYLECGLTGTDEIVDDVVAYTQNWGLWLKENKHQISQAIKEAKRAMDYIIKKSGVKIEEKVVTDKIINKNESIKKAQENRAKKYRIIYDNANKNSGIIIWGIEKNKIVTSCFTGNTYGRKAESQIKIDKENGRIFNRKGKVYRIQNMVEVTTFMAYAN